MKISAVFKIFLVVSFLMAVASVEVWADTSSIVNHASEAKENVIFESIFLHSAFSSTEWNSDSSVDDYKRFIQWRSESKFDLSKQKYREIYDSYSKSMPWLSDHLFKREPVSTIGKIHKWPDVISIGIGWPEYGESRWSLQYEEEYNIVEDQINKLIPQINTRINTPIFYIPAADPRETTISFAKLRIVIVDRIAMRSWQVSPKLKLSPDSQESRLWHGVLFERNVPREFYGYLLPDDDQNIDIAICKIKAGLGEEKTKRFVNECLVGALGLPGKLNSDFQISDVSNQSKLSKPVIDMITSLYCPSIRSGMNFSEVETVLKNNLCVKGE